jgi:hypothetical protein
MFHRFTKFATTAIAAGGLGLAAIAAAGTASALTGDNTQFFADIENAGIAYDSPAAAVKNAQTVCSLLADGESATAISSEIVSNSDLSTRQANAFVVASVESFCPKYASSVS